MQRFLVTGSAGSIGFHVAHRLLQEGKPVVGLDNLNDCFRTGRYPNSPWGNESFL